MKLRIHPAFMVYLALLTLIDGLGCALSLLVTLFVHESGHLLVGRLFNEEYERLEITPLGGILAYKAGCSSRKGIKGACIAAAGPVCSLGAAYLLCSASVCGVFPEKVTKSFFSMNISMFLLNILPILPLDGGRFVFSIGYYLFPIAPLINFLTALGRAAGILGLAFSFWGLLYFGKLNITLLVSGFYISVCSSTQREILYASSLHTAIQERLAAAPSLQPVQVFSVCKQDRLCSIIPVLCKAKNCVFIVELDDYPRFICERHVLDKLLNTPTVTFDEMISS